MRIEQAVSFFRILLLFAIFVTGCQDIDLQAEVPFCVERKIQKINREEVQNPPAKVWRWEANHQLYFYITSGCCDQLNFLYDESCNLVCAPDGGFSGGGDGSCPEFNDPIEITLVWEDDRTYK